MLMMRTPYGIHPYEEDNHRVTLGPNQAFRGGRLHLRLPGRARPLHVRRASSRTCGRNSKSKAGPRTSTKAPTPTTPSIGWSRTFRTTTATSACYGISYPGFYTSAGMINAHPALKAASPQAPIADWFFDDFYPSRRVLPVARVPLLRPLRRSAARTDDQIATAGSQLRHAGRLPVLPRPRPAEERQSAATSRTRSRSGTTMLGASELRQILAGPQSAAASEKRRARGHDGRRLVRCRGPVRHVSHLSGHREAKPGHLQRDGHRPLGARRLVVGGFHQPGQHRLRLQHVRLLSRRTSSCRSSIIS